MNPCEDKRALLIAREQEIIQKLELPIMLRSRKLALPVDNQGQEMFFFDFVKEHINSITENKKEAKKKRFMLKSQEGIQRLAGYKYEHKFVYNQKTMRTNTVLSCKYEGCTKVYNKTWDLLDHMRKHTGEKPYQCKTCLKRFSQRGNVIKHKKMHAKERKLALEAQNSRDEMTSNSISATKHISPKNEEPIVIVLD
ncbi:unnamed protein product [Moneuplotes crassus]|uniref:C2H2-type domain-containing protein n=1 Tax=Euplotes crassus TaxID=5936 RepID=A0AAD1XA32_EUPCR|nr:unnamed protein product [Moneuplotes crassus]